eukprot:Sspe_Gene.60376::Locus_33276_Transcript_1_1_Confidence_1.000_Length_2856::g.60376::m.60376
MSAPEVRKVLLNDEDVTHYDVTSEEEEPFESCLHHRRSDGSAFDAFRVAARETNVNLTDWEIDNAIRLYQRFSNHGTEEIDLHKLENIMVHLGFKMSTEQVRDLLTEVDLDGNGVVGFDEFVQLMQMWKEAQLFRVFQNDHHDITNHILDAFKAQLRGKFITDAQWRSAFYVLLMAGALYFWIVVLHDNNKMKFSSPGSTSEDALDIIFTIIFFIDLCLNLNTARLRDGVLIAHFSEIVTQYLLHEWMVLDVLSTVPVDIIVAHTKGRGTLWQGLRHLRLLRVLRVPWYFRPSERVRMNATYIQFHYGLRQYIEIIFWSLVGVHILVEAFIFIKQAEENYPFPYIKALYYVSYTLTTVGYGDDYVTSDLQRVYGCFLFVVGVLVNAVVTARIISMLRNVDVNAERRDKLRGTLALLQHFEVPRGLQEEILEYQAHVLDNSMSSGYQEVISNLPVSLQDSLNLYVRMKLVSKVPFFKDIHRACQMAVAQCLKPQTSSPDIYLASYGDQGDCMFFILHGFADVFGKDGQFLATLGKGSFFGELALLNNVPRAASVKAITYMDLLRLDRADFLALLPRFPKFRERILAYARKYSLRRADRVKPPPAIKTSSGTEVGAGDDCVMSFSNGTEIKSPSNPPSSCSGSQASHLSLTSPHLKDGVNSSVPVHPNPLLNMGIMSVPMSSVVKADTQQDERLLDVFHMDSTKNMGRPATMRDVSMLDKKLDRLMDLVTLPKTIVPGTPAAGGKDHPSLPNLAGRRMSKGSQHSEHDKPLVENTRPVGRSSTLRGEARIEELQEIVGSLVWGGFLAWLGAEGNLLKLKTWTEVTSLLQEYLESFAGPTRTISPILAPARNTRAYSVGAKDLPESVSTTSPPSMVLNTSGNPLIPTKSKDVLD